VFVPTPSTNSLTEAIDRALDRMWAESQDPMWPARVAGEMKSIARSINASRGFEKFVDGIYQNACVMLGDGHELRECIYAAVQSGIYLGLKASAEHYEGGMMEVPLDGPVQ
jgi:hypothetical protein